MTKLQTFEHIRLKEITTPTAVTNFGAVYTKSDNNLYFQDGTGTEYILQKTGIPKTHLEQADYSANYNGRRVRPIVGTGAFRLNFYIPKHFVGTLSIKALFFTGTGAGGTGKNIDLTGEVTIAAGQSYQQYTFSDLVSTYDCGTVDNLNTIDITSLIPPAALVPGAHGGVLWDNNSIGGTLHFLGFLTECV
jgi:hypothetical protein